MIGISKLYMSQIEPSDPLRYGRISTQLPSHLLQFSTDKRPIVVWNCTRKCNLSCLHCYAESPNAHDSISLNTDQAKVMIDDLALYKIPVLLFSGGEPFMRPDLIELAGYAKSKGIRVVFSTNGTLITPDILPKLKEIGLSYIGISLDGLQEAHNQLRQSNTAFQRAISAITEALNVGIKVGIRLTLHKQNVNDLPAIFKLISDLRIPRACFYHLVPTGAGAHIPNFSLTNTETRQAVDLIISETKKLYQSEQHTEILTVDNHCDGPYLYLRMKKENNPNAENVLKLLQMNGGNSSGWGLSCISWDGAVYPDQFWRTKELGNVLETPFSQIWSNPQNIFLNQLRNKYENVTGRCKRCRFLTLCGGNFRARAEAATNQLWGVDPACYLTDDEIS